MKTTKYYIINHPNQYICPRCHGKNFNNIEYKEVKATKRTIFSWIFFVMFVIMLLPLISKVFTKSFDYKDVKYWIACGCTLFLFTIFIFLRISKKKFESYLYPKNICPDCGYSCISQSMRPIKKPNSSRSK